MCAQSDEHDYERHHVQEHVLTYRWPLGARHQLSAVTSTARSISAVATALSTVQLRPAVERSLERGGTPV